MARYVLLIAERISTGERFSVGLRKAADFRLDPDDWTSGYSLRLAADGGTPWYVATGAPEATALRLVRADPTLRYVSRELVER